MTAFAAIKLESLRLQWVDLIPSTDRLFDWWSRLCENVHISKIGHEIPHTETESAAARRV